MKLADRSFWLATLGIAFLLASIEYAPVFTGKIPFPSDFIFDFPPYAASAPPEYPTPHTNIGDLVTSFYPYHALAARAAREWTVPLWNPYMLAGAPFLANTQSAIFYPFNFLYYLLPVPLAWTAGFFLRRILGALFMTLFMGRIGAAPTAAILSGLLFSFCGFLTGWQGQAMHDAAIWLPLVCYSTVRLLEEVDRRSVAIAAVAYAMPVLAGHPETAAHITLTGVALAVVLLRGSRAPGRFVVQFTACGILAMGLAAVQMLPTLEWLQNIHHLLPIWPPLPLWSMLATVARDTIHRSNSAGILYPEYAAYIGMLTFVTAPLALLHSRRRIVFFLVGWAAAAISVVYGIGPAFWMIHYIPVLKTLKNERLILVASFCAAVLAGLGITVLEDFRKSEKWRRRVEVAILAASGFLVAFLMVYVLHLFSSELIEFVRMNRFSVLLLAAGGGAVGLRVTGFLHRRPLQAVLLLVVAVDLVTVNRGAIPFTNPRDVFPPIELFDRLPRDPQPFRVAQLSASYGANFEVMYGLSGLCNYEIGLERIKTFLKDISKDEMDSVMLTTKAVLESKDRRVDMLNAKYYIITTWDPQHVEFQKQPERFRFMYTAGDTDVYENLKAMPAAFVVPASGAIVVEDEAAQLARVKDPFFNPEREVVLSRPISPAVPGASPSSGTSGRVEWLSRRTNAFELKVSTGESGILVVSQIDYPGWKASIDGQPVEITRANYALPAIFVPQGEHRIIFSFEPLSFRIGLLLSAVCICVIAVMFRYR
jgi:Bacterial membrane protein YfhO